MDSQTKIVRTQNKGMITIPANFRETLGIDTDTFLEARLIDNGIMFVKINTKLQQPSNLYSEKEINQWLKDDKLDLKTAQKIKRLLKP